MLSKLAALSLAATLTVALSGCPGPDCGDPIYAPGSTDEAWLTMQDGQKSVKTDDVNGANITSPSEDEQLSADAAAPLITWTSTLTASKEALTPARRTFATRVLDWVIPPAHAHLPPVTGPMHLLEISVPGQSCPVRVLTSKNEWEVGEDTWTLLRDNKGKDLTLTVTSAYLIENRISEGPYRASTPRIFQVK